MSQGRIPKGEFVGGRGNVLCDDRDAREELRADGRFEPIVVSGLPFAPGEVHGYWARRLPSLEDIDNRPHRRRGEW